MTIERLQAHYGLTRMPFGGALAPGCCTGTPPTPKPSPGSAGASPKPPSAWSPARSSLVCTAHPFPEVVSPGPGGTGTACWCWAFSLLGSVAGAGGPAGPDATPLRRRPGHRASPNRASAAGVMSMASPLRWPRLTCTALSSPRRTRSSTVWRATPSRARRLVEADPAGRHLRGDLRAQLIVDADAPRPAGAPAAPR